MRDTQRKATHSPQCPVCTLQSCREVGSYRGHSDLFVDRCLLSCEQCGLVFTHPMPGDEELSRYNEAYFVNAHGGAPTQKEAILFFSGIAQLRFHHISDYLGRRRMRPRTLLEIGPGPGFLCGEFLAAFPNVRYVAVESDGECRERLRRMGATVYGSLPDTGENPGGFDLVIFSHVLEHVSDPVAFVQRVVNLLHAGGCAFIEVPCRDDLFKDEHEPHLLFFDKPAMLELLSRVGLTEIQLTYHGEHLDQLQKERRLLARLTNRPRRVWRRVWKLRPQLGDPMLGRLREPAERAAVAPFKAHLTREQPSWWLRALAQKADGWRPVDDGSTLREGADGIR